jgi:hypothetical protein
MNNILWIALIIGAFFLMHKMGLGCCGGHAHGGHHHEKEGENEPGKDADGEKKVTHSGCH